MKYFEFGDEFHIREEPDALAPIGPQSVVPYQSTGIDYEALRGIGISIRDSNANNEVRSWEERRVDTAGIRASAMVATSRVPVERGSTTTPNAGMLGIRFPYLTIIRPRVEYPTLYNEHIGRPTNVSDTLSSFTGYTVVEAIHLDGVTATQPEKEELEALLKGGVIL